MAPRQLMLLLVVAGVVCLLIGVYYLIPGVYHLLAFSGDPNSTRPKHALLFFGLAVLGFVGAWIFSGRKAPKVG
jgi:uncharacterized membrane protein